MKFQSFLTASANTPDLRSRKNDVSAALGLGLEGRLFDVARWELNLCWPLAFINQKHSQQPALSFGIGSEFL